MTTTRRRLRRAVAPATLAVIALLLASPAAGAYMTLVPDASSSGTTVVPFDSVAGIPGTPIQAGTSLTGVAITPNGLMAYVVGASSATVTPISLSGSSPTAGTPIALGTDGSQTDQPNSIAINPQGTMAYVTDEANDVVVPIDLATTPATVEAAISLGPGTEPQGIAISPDGTVAYVADFRSGTVSMINLSDDLLVNTIDVGTSPAQIAITPDGTTAYVTDNGSDVVYPLNLTTAPPTVGTPIEVGNGPVGIAITPDGTTAFVTNFGPESTGAGSGDTVTPIDLATQTPESPIAVGNGPWGVAVTPDGATAWVTNSNDETATPISTLTDTGGLPVSTGVAGRSIAIAPDQPPVASLTVTPETAGTATTFDASASTVAAGTIASYAWSFGDGTTATTTTPTTTHVYANPGTYTALVRETDSAGTSTLQVFTGQTVSLNGGESAVASQSVTVPGGATTGPTGPTGPTGVTGGNPPPPTTPPPTTLTPPAAIAVSPAGVTFPATAVGHASAPQGITLTNIGASAVTLTGSTIFGANGGDFALTADGCTGQTLAPGGSCSADVAFTPSGTGSRTGVLAFIDSSDANPQTITLSGIGTTVGGVSGQVRDGTQSGSPPIAGAGVQICPAGVPSSSSCQYTTTDFDGAYEFSGLAPGAYAIEVTPPTQALFGASIVLNVPAGSQTQDFVLQAPVDLSTQVTVSSVAGSYSGGVPIIDWNGPFLISHPLDVPASGTAGSTLTLIVQDAIYATGGGYGAQTGLTVSYRYGTNGHPNLVGVAPLVGAPPPQASLTPPGDTASVARVASAASSTAAHSLSIEDLLNQSPASVSTTGNLGAALHGDVGIADLQYAEPKGYTRDPADPSRQLPVCPSGFHVADVNVSLIATSSGPVLQRECVPGPDPQQPQTGDVRIDPSGLVATRAGVPVAGATVILQRASLLAGPFKSPAAGTAGIVPSVGQEQTNALGHYGWDVTPGYYRVVVTRPGCTAGGAGHRGARLVSPTVRIPPGATNLKLTLACPTLHRAASKVMVKAKVLLSAKGHPLSVTVRVAAARRQATAGTLAGVIILRGPSGRVLATWPLDTRASSTTIALTGAAPDRLEATYSGDAYYSASATQASVGVG